MFRAFGLVHVSGVSPGVRLGSRSWRLLDIKSCKALSQEPRGFLMALFRELLIQPFLCVFPVFQSFAGKRPSRRGRGGLGF